MAEYQWPEHCQIGQFDSGSLAGVYPLESRSGRPDMEMREYVRADVAGAELDSVRDLVLGLAQACNETGNPVVPTPVAEAISALTSWAREERA